jgi:uncharacterized Ntn-hydrolase superfamily protein
MAIGHIAQEKNASKTRGGTPHGTQHAALSVMPSAEREATAAKWTYDRVRRARDAVGALLARLDLDAYLFGVEPRGDHWEARVEFASEDGWRTTVLNIDDSELLVSLEKAAVQDRLVESWRASFADAKRPARS